MSDRHIKMLEHLRDDITMRSAIEGYEKGVVFVGWSAWDGLNTVIDELKAAQAQAGQPIAAVHGWFHGECVIRALDPEAVLPAGMALYSQPQAQAVNQQLLEALQKAESHLHAMMAHIEHKPQRFQEHCWQQVLDIRAAIAAAQEQSK